MHDIDGVLRRCQPAFDDHRRSDGIQSGRVAALPATLGAIVGETLRGLESGDPSSIQDRVNSAVQGARGLTGAPTGTQHRNYDIANEDVTAQITALRALDAELRKFEQQLEAAGVPYTTGRIPG